MSEVVKKESQESTKENSFSFSRLKLYSQCPRAYFYRYIDEESKRNIPSEMMAIGTNNHLIIQEAIEQGDLEVLPEKMRPIIQKYLLGAEIEKEIGFELPNGVKMTGFVDLCSYDPETKTVYIMDLKLYLEPENDDQLKIYALGLREQYPDAEYYRCWFYMLGADYYKSFLYSNEDIDKFYVELIDKVEAVLSDTEYPINPGSYCSTCSYVHKCNALMEYEITPIDSPERAADILKAVYVAEGYVKQFKEQVMRYMMENGLSEIQFAMDDGQEVRFYLSSSVSMRSSKVRKKSKK